MKNIVIIGASRGIGKALALQLANDHKVLALSRNQEKLDVLKTEVTSDHLFTGVIDISSDDTKTI